MRPPPKRLVLKDCGRHYGATTGDCPKCRRPDCATKQRLLAAYNATVHPPAGQPF